MVQLANPIRGVTMRNEKGMTLVELLVAVVIGGMVIIPLMLVMTGSFTRTTAHGTDTNLAYFGQQVMEKVRRNELATTSYACYKTTGCVAWNNQTDHTAKVDVTSTTQTYGTGISFKEVKVVVTSRTNSQDKVELVTVVKN